MAAPSPLRCPYCNKPLPQSPGARCPSCGRDIAGAFARRASRPPTRGLKGVFHKYPWLAYLIMGPILLVMAGVEYSNLTSFEAAGGSYSDQSFNIFLYHLGGKWGVVGFWGIAAVVCLGNAFRLFHRARPV
jgi:hypothetical protein